jgi:hypothetical protein
MPTNFKATYKAKFHRSGPFLKTMPNVRQVEGNASSAFSALVQGLDEIPKIVHEQVESTVRTFTEAHSEEEKRDSQSVLYQKPNKRRTGHLDSSFTTSIESDAKSVRGYSRNNAKYAIFHELGFHHWRNGRYINPKPFMFPAFGRSKDAFMKAIREIFGK